MVAEEIAKALNQRRPAKLQFTLGEAAEMLNVPRAGSPAKRGRKTRRIGKWVTSGCSLSRT